MNNNRSGVPFENQPKEAMPENLREELSLRLNFKRKPFLIPLIAEHPKSSIFSVEKSKI